jgi:formylglycine-generating enzyme required for sulfatase activity
MNTAAAKKSSFGIKFLKPWLIGLAAVGLIGAAIVSDDHAVTPAPRVAERPVILPDRTALYVQKYEVTVAEWNLCHAAGACTLKLRVTGNQTEAAMPATGLAYPDVSQYLAWINNATHQGFRLPTLREWEFMAAEVMPATPDPIFTDPDLSWASAYLLEPQTKRTLRPQGAFATTSHGIVDLNGSVWEWTAECYSGAQKHDIPADDCPAFFVGGEHIAALPYLVRDPARGGCAVGAPPAHLGMRLVRDERSG